MVITNVFDDLSDPVFTLSPQGEVSYSNTAAKSLIQGDTVDTLGVGPLQRIFVQLENHDLAMPMSFVFTTADSQRYQANINHLYSAYVIHCRRIDSPDSGQQFTKKIVDMLHECLSDPLEKFEIAMESQLAELAAKDHLGQSQKAQFDKLIEQSKRLSCRISQIRKLSELYILDELPDYELISVRQLLCKVIEEPELVEEFGKRLSIQSDSDDSLNCDISWMLSAIVACARQVLRDGNDEQTLIIQHTSNKFFHQIGMVLVEGPISELGDLSLSQSYNIYRDHEHTELLDIDLIIAGRVVDMHGGRLKYTPTNDKSLVLEIPISGHKTNQDLSSQAKIYAQDLAEAIAHVFK